MMVLLLLLLEELNIRSCHFHLLLLSRHHHNFVFRLAFRFRVTAGRAVTGIGTGDAQVVFARIGW